jgi:hypothetical protein
MPPRHTRLRTILIVIASAALLMVLLRCLLAVRLSHLVIAIYGAYAIGLLAIMFLVPFAGAAIVIWAVTLRFHRKRETHRALPRTEGIWDREFDR